MFENIIGHDRTVGLLRKEIESGTLPSSILLYGDRYAGKLSTALEVARALGCSEGTAQWNCRCPECGRQRLLLDPATLLLGTRYFEKEIAAAADVLAQTRKESGQFLYLRSVRKLLRRFDPVLWEGNEPKLKAAATAIRDTEDRLSDVAPGSALPEGDKLTKALEKLGELTATIASSVPEGIPIHQVRRAVYWSHSSGEGSPKVIILEGAEQLNDSARNALLRILEEPPRSTYLLLLATRRAAVLPTILSRVRQIHLAPRSRESEQAVLAKIFRREVGESAGLRDFFLGYGGLDAETLRRMARGFVAALLDHDGVQPPGDEMAQAAARETRAFLEAIADAFGERLRSDAGEKPGLLPKIERLARLLRETAARSESYNQQPSLLVEGLFYRMRELL